MCQDYDVVAIEIRPINLYILCTEMTVSLVYDYRTITSIAYDILCVFILINL